MASYRISVPESLIRFIAKEINDWRENAYDLGLDLTEVFQFNTTLIKKLQEIDQGKTLPNNPKSSNGNIKQSVVDKIALKQESSEFAGLNGEEMMAKLLEEQEKHKQKLAEEKQSEDKKVKALFNENEL